MIADQCAAEFVDVVEVVKEALQERRAVRGGLLHEFVKQAAGQSLGVIVGLQKERWDWGDQDSLLDPLGAVGAEVAGHLAGAHRVSDQRDVGQVELVHQGVKVRGEGVVVVATAGLARLPESAAIVCDHTVPSLHQDRHLLVPRAAAQWVAMDQNHRALERHDTHGSEGPHDLALEGETVRADESAYNYSKAFARVSRSLTDLAKSGTISQRGSRTN